MTDAEAMLQDCLKRYKKLSDYEMGFIDNLSQMDGMEHLTPRQYEKLEEIWERIT